MLHDKSRSYIITTASSLERKLQQVCKMNYYLYGIGKKCFKP